MISRKGIATPQKASRDRRVISQVPEGCEHGDVPEMTSIGNTRAMMLFVVFSKVK